MRTLLQPVLISILAGAFIFLIPKKLRKIVEGFSIVTAIYLFLAAIKIFIGAPIQGKFLYIDGLSKFIVLGIGFFGALVCLYSLRFMASYKEFRSYYVYIIWTIGFSILSAVSNNIVLLLVSWGFLGFTFYMLINIQGAHSSATAKKALIIIGGSDTLMILGFAIVWFLTGELNLSNIRIPIQNCLSFWAFLLISVGSFAKAGAMPFHTWIPDVAEDAPITVTSFLPASLDKLLGIYLLARLVLNVFVLDSFSHSLLMVVGAITIIASVMMALIQHNFKRLLGYHAVSQVGYMVLGLGTGNIIGIAGGLFHMLNHAIYKCCLFLSGGNVENKTRTSDIDKLGGLATIMPITFWTSLVASFAISGVPPFNGFFSKWMIYQGLIEKGVSDGGTLWLFCIVASMFGSALTLASFIKFIHAIFLGKAYTKDRDIADSYPRHLGTGADLVLKRNLSDDSRTTNDKRRDEVSWSMWLPPVILATLCVVFGVFAFIIPLKFFIIPALPGTLKFIGSWQSLKATLFLLIGIAVGFLLYLMGNFKGIRETSPYIGGEKLKQNMRLSGAEFYATIKELPILRSIYAHAERKVFDIYDQGRNIVFLFIRPFQYLHNGVLPTYLVWCLLGMIVLLFSIVK